MAGDTSERDIELVLVTGAGASRSFGVAGQQLPLMQDWSDAVCETLIRTDYRHLQLTGLEKGLDGPEFEQRLGDFLRRVEAFKLIEPLVGVSPPTQQIPPLSTEALRGWYQQEKFNLEKVVDLIHTSLYEQFAEQAFDLVRATKAYGELLEVLGVLGPTRPPFVVATTNYDPIAEEVLTMNSLLPDWGQKPMVNLTQSETGIEARGLIQGLPRYVPVLHLHGRIGWYSREVGGPYESTMKNHSAQFGTPIVMLPDPKKDYGSITLINDLWTEFGLALRRAKRVFILGHSLNDEPLRRAVVENVDDLSRVAVGVYSEDGSEPHETTEKLQRIIREELVGAATILMCFGTILNRDAIANFMDRTHRAGFGPA